MKKLFQIKRSKILIVLILFSNLINAQVRHIRYSPLAISDFSLSIRNVVQTTDRTIDFDVYLLDTDPTQPFEISSAQLGILFDLSIKSTGTLTLIMNNTNSGLNATNQAFPSSSLVIAPTGYPTKGLIRVSGKSTTAGSGAIISTTGNGTFLSHFTLTNTVAWTSGSSPNLIFTSNTVTNPLYPTKVNMFIGTTDTNLSVTPGTNAIVDGNPVLNAAPTAYAVTGSGSFCQDGLGLAVGLSNSDIGVNYQLYSGETAVGSPVAGTGSAISFGNQTAGTYTVTATNTTTLITGSMTGSAVITANPPVTPDVSIEASSNPAATGASVTFTPTPVNGGLNPAYEWFVNNVSVGTGETYSYIPTDGDLIYTKMTSNDTSPCLTGNPATSNTITMSVSPGTGFSNEKALRINTYSTNKAIYIDCPTKIQQLSVYNMLGSVVAMEENVSGLRKINLNNFPNECYIVKVVTDNNVTTQKILLK